MLVCSTTTHLHWTECCPRNRNLCDNFQAIPKKKVTNVLVAETLRRYPLQRFFFFPHNESWWSMLCHFLPYCRVKKEPVVVSEWSLAVWPDPIVNCCYSTRTTGTSLLKTWKQRPDEVKACQGHWIHPILFSANMAFVGVHCHCKKWKKSTDQDKEFSLQNRFYLPWFLVAMSSVQLSVHGRTPLCWIDHPLPPC